MDKSILIGDIVKITQRENNKDYIWQKQRCRVDDICNNVIVLKRETDFGEYKVCVTLADLICHDVILTVYRGKSKWNLEYSQ